jgi:hypothetical protein
LAANGVGIGSFVYLRRIFEDLVGEAYLEGLKEGKITKDQYKGRVDDKIELLKAYLPDFLVKHKQIYSILSLGIHELSEDVCLQHFEAVKAGIELILDEKLVKKEKALKLEEASKKISAIAQQLKTD